MNKRFLLTLITLLIGGTFAHAQNYKFHTIKDGETLWRISKNYNVTMDELCKINQISDATKVKQGMKLKIPANEPKSTASNQTVTTQTKSESKGLSILTPMNGSIKPFVTPNIKGIVIFSQNQQTKSEVISIEAGTVSFIDELDGYGLSVLIKHPNNMLSIYSGFENVNVRKGDKVTKGQFIGNAGRLAKFDKVGIVFSVQKNQEFLKYNMTQGQFVQ